MATFKVDNVKKGSHKLSEWHKNDANRLKLVGLGVEGSSGKGDEVTYGTNNFVAALNTAYDQHLPLVLSPDILWLVIAQGLSLHVTNNAEELRHQFVNHEGKQHIEIYENSFVKGSPDNDWSHAFGQFSDRIKDYIGKKRDLIVGDYSTTTAIDRAANEIILMEAMSKYFSYGMTTMCGIPEITLLGTVEDYKAIKGRVQAMSEFNLSWWTSKLEPIVDEFILAAQGKPNTTFWQRIYKESGGSGGPYIGGWMTHLFPYLRGRGGAFDHKNDFTAKGETFSGLTDSSFHPGISKAEFVWTYYTQKFDMELGAGFTGYKYENDAIVPNVGWTVRDVNKDVQVKLMPTVSNSDYKEREAFTKRVSKEAAALGMTVSGGWRNVEGVIAKDKLESLKSIDGVKVVSGQGDDDDE
jgi:hypothetical protein